MFYNVFGPTHTLRTHQTSVDTQKPVRVVRGFKNHSPYGPQEGSVSVVASL